LWIVPKWWWNVKTWEHFWTEWSPPKSQRQFENGLFWNKVNHYLFNYCVIALPIFNANTYKFFCFRVFMRWKIMHNICQTWELLETWELIEMWLPLLTNFSWTVSTGRIIDELLICLLVRGVGRFFLDLDDIKTCSIAVNWTQYQQGWVLITLPYLIVTLLWLETTIHYYQLTGLLGNQ